MKMHTKLFLFLVALAATGVVVFAQGTKEGATKPAVTKPAATTPAEGTDAQAVFTGRSINANLQEALNDALQKAQLALSKNVADAQFTYRVDAITGKRGGIAGVNEITLDIKIVR